MRRTLGTLALALASVLLAGCGSGDDGSAQDPADSTTSSTSETPPVDEPTSDAPTSAGGLDYEVVSLISETGAGGRVSESATPVTDDRALRGFTRQFRSRSLAAKVGDATDGGRDPGVTTYVATIAIGCDIPPGVTVTAGEAGLLVSPTKVTDPLQECLAPVTTVAVIDVVDAQQG